MNFMLRAASAIKTVAVVADLMLDKITFVCSNRRPRRR